MKSVKRLLFLLVSVQIGAALPGTDEDTSALVTKALQIGSEPELCVDDHLIERMDGVRLHMHPPECEEIVFRFDAPWEGPECGYVTMMQVAGGFRMYYRGGGETTCEVTCMAQSSDGIHWQRPTLGLVEFNGSKSNNIIWTGRTKAYSESHNFTPFVDTNPASKADERFKAVAYTKFKDAAGENQRGLAALVSPDGIHWKRLREEPIQIKGGFDSQNLAFWDSNHGQYACYFREGRDGVRSIRRSMSLDFLNWSPPEWLDFGDAPIEQFYTSAIAPYIRNAHLYVGFPMRFVPERRTIGANQRPVDALSDGVMISSRDGLHFQRKFREAFIRPGLDPKNWGNGHGNNAPAWGLLQTSSNEISIYWCEHYGADFSEKKGRMVTNGAPQLRRGTVRLDGFASANAGFAGGEFVTKPLTFRGGKLVLNFSTSAVGSVRVEVQDATGKAIPGFALVDCAEIYGDEIAREVSWKGESGLSRFAGKLIRLRFAMKDADIYSISFR